MLGDCQPPAAKRQSIVSARLAPYADTGLLAWRRHARGSAVLGATLLRCRVGALVPIQVRLAEISIDVCFEVRKGPLYPHAPEREHFFDMDKVQDTPF